MQLVPGRSAASRSEAPVMPRTRSVMLIVPYDRVGNTRSSCSLVLAQAQPVPHCHSGSSSILLIERVVYVHMIPLKRRLNAILESPHQA